MNREKYLPIGSVVLLKDATKRIMVIGFNAKDSEKEYDYVGVLYPEGLQKSERKLVFNHEQINKVYCTGYIDDEWDKVQIKIKEALVEKNSDNKMDINTLDIPIMAYESNLDDDSLLEVFEI